jgi:dipeptidyl aminopeptidase/acylaminoacyl peptidase
MSDERTTLSYGLWPSPLSPQDMAEGTRLSDVAWDSDGQTLVWLEGRSDRGVLVCATGDDAPRDLTTNLSVRARVGYGGGDFAVAGGYVYFAEASSGRLYRQPLATGLARAITPAFGVAAAPAVSPDGRWVVYVHSDEGVDRLAVVDAAGKHWPQSLVVGADFYMQPCWHPDSARLAWIEWDHPNMPWDGTRLCVGTVRVETGGLPAIGDVRTVAGGPGTAIFGPAFAPDGRALAYISDKTGWDNLYLYDLAGGTARALTSEQAEMGQPAWAQGMRTVAFFSEDGLLFLRNEAGFRECWGYDLEREQAQALPGMLDGYTWIEQPAVAPQSGRVAVIASSSTTSARIVSTDEHGGNPRVLARASSENVPQADLSTPRPVSWTNPEGGATAHGLYYPPASSRYTGTGLPPAILYVHGGPTSAATSAYNATAQFFTTRGYAVLALNYRGSTGYGRDYAQALRENWGVADIEDTAGAALYLGAAGLTDPGRLVIMGGSAGGYTVLQTLVTHPGLVKAAVCMFGVSNLFTLASDTHKFEARYLDSLIGPLPETSQRYRERSPIFFADKISDPVAIFQGSIDQVVPRAQSDTIVEALRRRGVPHEYHVYEGEGHGWRKRETIAAFYTAVDRFLKQYVLFG